MNKSIFILCAVAVLVAFGCSEAKRAAEVTLPSTSPDGTTTVTQVEGVTDDSVLYFKLGMKWETDSGDYSTVKTCFLPPASAVGSVQTCTISIPELQLFHSKLNFKVGTLDGAACPFVSFQPYYYRRSRQDMINSWDPDATTVTCATEPYSKTCFGGAAPEMLGEDFGVKNVGYHFMSLITNEGNFPLKSSDEVRQLGSNVNFMVTNDIVNATLGRETAPTVPMPIPIVDAFEKVVGAGTWVDYSVNCLDIWGATTHQIQIKISDENTATSTGGAVDHYPDWPY